MGLALCRRADDTDEGFKGGIGSSPPAQITDPRIRERQLKKYKTLEKVLGEILASERKYVDFLCVLSDVYYKPMIEQAKALHLSPKQLATVHVIISRVNCAWRMCICLFVRALACKDAALQ